jgi:hypothetical protein
MIFQNFSLMVCHVAIQNLLALINGKLVKKKYFVTNNLINSDKKCFITQFATNNLINSDKKCFITQFVTKDVSYGEIIFCH